MTNIEFQRNQSDTQLASLICGLFKCDNCPFKDKKPEEEEENCVLYWFHQQHPLFPDESGKDTDA